MVTSISGTITGTLAAGWKVAADAADLADSQDVGDILGAWEYGQPASPETPILLAVASGPASEDRGSPDEMWETTSAAADDYPSMQVERADAVGAAGDPVIYISIESEEDIGLGRYTVLFAMFHDEETVVQGALSTAGEMDSQAIADTKALIESIEFE